MQKLRQSTKLSLFKFREMLTNHCSIFHFSPVQLKLNSITWKIFCSKQWLFGRYWACRWTAEKWTTLQQNNMFKLSLISSKKIANMHIWDLKLKQTKQERYFCKRICRPKEQKFNLRLCFKISLLKTKLTYGVLHCFRKPAQPPSLQTGEQNDFLHEKVFLFLGKT